MDQREEARRLLKKLVPDEDLFRAQLQGRGRTHRGVYEALTKVCDVRPFDKALKYLEGKKGVEEAVKVLKKERQERQDHADLIGPAQGGRRRTAAELERAWAAGRIYDLLKGRGVKRVGYSGALLMWYLRYFDFPPAEGATSKNSDSMITLFWTLKGRDTFK